MHQSVSTYKTRAKLLKRFLQNAGIKLPYSSCLEAQAAQENLTSWDALSALAVQIIEAPSVSPWMGRTEGFPPSEGQLLVDTNWGCRCAYYLDDKSTPPRFQDVATRCDEGMTDWNRPDRGAFQVFRWRPMPESGATGEVGSTQDRPGEDEKRMVEAFLRYMATAAVNSPDPSNLGWTNDTLDYIAIRYSVLEQGLREMLAPRSLGDSNQGLNRDWPWAELRKILARNSLLFMRHSGSLTKDGQFMAKIGVANYRGLVLVNKEVLNRELGYAPSAWGECQFRIELKGRDIYAWNN